MEAKLKAREKRLSEAGSALQCRSLQSEVLKVKTEFDPLKLMAGETLNSSGVRSTAGSKAAGNILAIVDYMVVGIRKK